METERKKRKKDCVCTVKSRWIYNYDRASFVLLRIITSTSLKFIRKEYFSMAFEKCQVDVDKHHTKENESTSFVVHLLLFNEDELIVHMNKTEQESSLSYCLDDCNRINRHDPPCVFSIPIHRTYKCHQANTITFSDCCCQPLSIAEHRNQSSLK